MPNTFETVARTIVHEAIKSAVFIDDQIPMLFVQPNEDDKAAYLCEPLYKSFHEKQCSLDFYKFNQDWQNKTDLLLERKDLLILDWELDKVEPAYKSALEIINKAIFTDNLHFVCIYSNSDDAVEGIFYKILSYYSLLKKNEAEKALDDLTDFLDTEWGGNSDDFLNPLKSKLKRLTLSGNKQLYKEINGDIYKVLGKEINVKFKEKLTEFFPPHKSFCELSLLGFVLNGELDNKTAEKKVYVKSDASHNYLQINNTLFAVFKKGEYKADELYKNFCDAIIKANENFLTLMSLEIRNKVLKRSAFIGKEIGSIKEKAFFHHMAKVEPENAFPEYLIELWKTYNTVFLYSEKPELFSVLEEYKEAKNIDQQVDHDELALLNYYYNINHYAVGNRSIGFGDVFKIEKNNTIEYLMCITPHCDCLRPDDKIKGFYYFVSGEKISINSGLEKPESDFLSFIKSDNNDIICIKWDKRPFTIYLCNDQRNIAKVNSIVYGKDVYDFHYCGTIKENYAQRIANNAIPNPLKVGITFVKK